MTRCPDCGSPDLQSTGLERGERIDDDHAVLVSKMRCRTCRCQFKETQKTEWSVEVLAHGFPDLLLMTEPSP